MVITDLEKVFYNVKINSDLTRIKNINALVCGGSKGIGLASAIKLAHMGANVFCFPEVLKSWPWPQKNFR